MRDKRFVAEHRGGPLNKAQHRQLIKWACICVGNVLPLAVEEPDRRVKLAIEVAEKWEKGNASVGDARKASVAAHAAARESRDLLAEAIARASGHAVATAHMADHALGAALYSLKAANITGKSVEAERMWQNEQLPPEIKELVLTARIYKESHFKI